MATQMREHILGVASTLFAERGINATSVDTIVEHAGIAKVTLYKYFKSKELLILEYLRQYNARLWQRLGERAPQAAATPREKLLGLTHATLDWIADPEFKGFAFVNASVEFPQAENPIHQASLEFAQSLRDALANLAQESGIHNAESLALQLALIIEGAAITERMQREAGATDHAKELAQLLIDTAV